MNKRLLTITEIAILTALTVSLSLLFIIPVPATKGLVTLCEVGIYTTAILMNNPGGFAVGASSGFLIDIISGYPQWSLFSLVIHGLQGLVVAMIMRKHFNYRRMTLALIFGSIVMVIGYFLATWFLYGLGAGIASITSNIVQNIFGIIVTVPVVSALYKIKPQFFNKEYFKA